MKECFRRWTRLGRDIWEDKRTGFFESIIDTNILFTELAEKLDQKQTAHDEQFTDTTDTQPHQEAAFFNIKKAPYNRGVKLSF